MQKKKLVLALVLVGSSLSAFAAAAPKEPCSALTGAYQIDGLLYHDHENYINVKVSQVDGYNISGTFYMMPGNQDEVPFKGTCTEQNGSISGLTLKATSSPRDADIIATGFSVYQDNPPWFALGSENVQGYFTDAEGKKVVIGENSSMSILFKTNSGKS